MTNFVHIDLSSHVLIFESPWRPNMTSSQTAGFLTYWQSAYHPSIYAIICFNHSLVHLSVGTNSTRLYQEFTYSILNTTVSFDPNAHFLWRLLQPNAMSQWNLDPRWICWHPPGVILEHHLEKTLTFLAFFDGSPKHLAFLEVPPSAAIFVGLRKRREWGKSDLMEIWESHFLFQYLNLYGCFQQ